MDRTVVSTGPPARGQLRPMLATPAATTPPGDGWAFEMKWDGVRCLLDVTEDAPPRLTSRTGRDQTAQYPELAGLAALVSAASAVLDGEIVALDDDGRPSFSLLQPRMQATREMEIARAASAAPVHLMLFDVLAVDGHDLTDRRYDERRTLLEELVIPGRLVHVPPVNPDGEAALATSLQLGLEGVVAKRRSAAYLRGTRSTSWLKIKHTMSVEVLVIGWRAGAGSRAGGVGSLLLAVPTPHGLRYVGRVGSGFTDRDVSSWPAMFEPLLMTEAAAQVPALDARDALWLAPRLVAEVEFGEWSPAGRLRHPRWRGWRPDKGPDDITRDDVRA